MGSYCPKDHKPCPDDLCHGGGCIRLRGEPMLDICRQCKNFFEPFADQEFCEYCSQEHEAGDYDDA